MMTKRLMLLISLLSIGGLMAADSDLSLHRSLAVLPAGVATVLKRTDATSFDKLVSNFVERVVAAESGLSMIDFTTEMQIKFGSYILCRGFFEELFPEGHRYREVAAGWVAAAQEYMSRAVRGVASSQGSADSGA